MADGTDTKNIAELHDRAVEERATAARQELDENGQEAADATTVLEAKSASALEDPTRDVGDHYAQKFANQPENPKHAPHLKDVADEDKVRLELSDSDHPDPANPKVTYVHPGMVADYLRAGWRQPSV